jgi:pimeloyl-ACP methyl ester carboxylesterase
MNRHLPFLPLLFCLILASCLPANKVPIESFYPAPATVQHSNLVVLLPGRGSGARSFSDEGLVRELLEQRRDVDVVAIEAHLGYYRDRSLPLRLKEDVIDPARKRGYRSIWLVGTSMGGLGAIMYDTTYPGDVTGILLLAPYLGEGSLLREIRSAGGLARWQPGEIPDQDVERAIWQRLSRYRAPEQSVKRVYLGFGSEDRFAVTNSFFAESLPAGQVVTVQGGHDWQTWRALWHKLLTENAVLPEEHKEMTKR